MTSKATTVEEYLSELPEDRRVAVEAIRNEINKNLPKGYEEGIQYGMIGWFVPHSIYPSGYHCDSKQPLPFMSVANQKNHIGFYAFCIYTDNEVKDWFLSEYEKTGLKIDMGKSCVRFKKLDKIPFSLIGQVAAKVPVDKFIAAYEEAKARSFR